MAYSKWSHGGIVSAVVAAPYYWFPGFSVAVVRPREQCANASKCVLFW